MDKEQTRKMNANLANLRAVYDQVEKTSELLYAEITKRVYNGNELGLLNALRSVSCDEHQEIESRLISSLAQFGIIRLLLNEAERDHADMLLGIEKGGGT